MAGEAREKCAVSGVLVTDEELAASSFVYESLYAMQHRGAEASGITSELPDGTIVSHRELGMVRDVYNPKTMARLAGELAIGHNRYSTSGSRYSHPQPFKDTPTGLGYAHNGNLPITDRLERHLAHHNIRTERTNDSEMMGLAIAQYIRNGQDVADAVELAYPLFRGAFSSIAMHDGALVAFRDPKGIRPLALGKFDDGYAIASETCGLDIIDANYEREVEPGEMVIITSDGIESRQLAEGDPKLDMFEFVYFARPDSQLYGQRVNEVRRRFGEQLADQHPPQTEDSSNIIVVPVPETSSPAAEGYAQRLGLTKKDAVIKNRYIGRTFMQPPQQGRLTHLRRKHSVVPEVVKGRDTIFIDDSIVRLNTIPRLVELANQAGAKSVTVLNASSPVRFPDFYGIDTPSQDELAAAVMTVAEMQAEIGCNYLGFLSLDRMVEATGLAASSFNLSCFTGEYPIGIGVRKREIKTPVSMEYVD